MPPANVPSRRLAALLRERREELIQRWTERVLRDPRLGDANRLSEPELHDHVPQIIDELGRVLEASKASEACGRDLGASEGAREHARTRLAKGFRVAEALREFSHFRAAVLDLCNAAGVTLTGDVAELVHAAIDQNMITGACEMEQAELARSEERAAVRERFVGIFGHDLRDPLQAIGFAHAALLAREDTTPGQAALVRRASASADRMARMIHDLLDVTRARLGSGISIDRRPARLDRICRPVVDELSLAHPGRVLDLDAPVAAAGEYDPDRLAQVVSNLVGNALKHGSPDTPVRISLREERTEAVLSVQNHGPAIPAGAQTHIFDPFRQEQPPGGRPGQDSLGLGLFIVKQIVEAHGGSIAVVSTPEEGTTFTVRLPRASEDDASGRPLDASRAPG
jgi:signal transduction histidine kinase